LESVTVWNLESYSVKNNNEKTLHFLKRIGLLLQAKNAAETYLFGSTGKAIFNPEM
jgi:hypothetical protein